MDWKCRVNKQCRKVPYSRKLSREKTIELFVAIDKIWGHDIFWWHQEAICESLLHENLFPPNSHKFSPTKVSRYMVCNEKDIRVSYCKTNSARKYHKTAK